MIVWGTQNYAIDFSCFLSSGPQHKELEYVAASELQSATIIRQQQPMYVSNQQQIWDLRRVITGPERSSEPCFHLSINGRRNTDVNDSGGGASWKFNELKSWHWEKKLMQIYVQSHLGVISK